MRPGLVLRFNRIYILPTLQGLGFAAAVCVMLLGAVNYGNALGYALSFLLISAGLVSMLHAVRNLAGLRLTRLDSAPAFAGDQARFRLNVDNDGQRRRFALLARLPSGEGRRHEDDPVAHFRLDADDVRAVELPAIARERGWYSPGRIVLATRFPFGWFRAWSRSELGLRCLVYPRPVGEQALPEREPDEFGEHGARGRGEDEFSGLRDYQQGDSARRIHWKAVARDQGVPVKIFTGANSGVTVLRWQDVAGGDTEARLSQLCRWVVDADTADLRYGLALPGVDIPPDSGDAHRHRCLEALALYEDGPDGGQEHG
jgi:uncharacterized protein (DUF58 family)